MISFNRRNCLRWKLVLATKLQGGWPGFLAPFETRYLNQTVTITTTSDYGGGSVVRSQAYVTDRMTGLVSSADGNENAVAYIPYGEFDSSYVEVTDTYFKQVVDNGYNTIQIEVTLSNPYDLTTLDSDINALLSSVSVASMPWNTLQIAAGPDEEISLGPYTPNADLLTLLPPQVTYPGIVAPGPNAIPQLNAAAWCIYAPGTVSYQDYFANAYCKLIGYFAMAGDYCQKTNWLDYNLKPLNQTCQNGVGACSSTFKITPPAIIPGQNAYVMLYPGQQCGQ